MNYEDAARVMRDRYFMIDPHNKMDEVETGSKLIREAHEMIAKHYGFHSIEEMDAAMVQHAGKWQDYMDRRSKHLPIRRG